MKRQAFEGRYSLEGFARNGLRAKKAAVTIVTDAAKRSVPRASYPFSWVRTGTRRWRGKGTSSTRCSFWI